MKYPFRPQTNSISRLFLFLVVILLLGSFALATGFYHSPLFTTEDRQIDQPVLFSHKHHVQGVGLDCRYCHYSVERSAFAGIPDAATCVGCHSQIWKTSELLNVVRNSVVNNKPLVWYRVNVLPDHVFFDHQIHLAKGIGCVSCHGAVSQMPVVVQKRSFLMRDCISCHQHPEKFVRPVSELLNESWRTEEHPDETAQALQELGTHALPTTNCNLCHR